MGALVAELGSRRRCLFREGEVLRGGADLVEELLWIDRLEPMPSVLGKEVNPVSSEEHLETMESSEG